MKVQIAQKKLKGYKQTEIGVIPEDWIVDNLGNFVQIRSGESPSKFQISKSGVPYFKVDQLNNSIKYQKETPYFIDIANPVRAKSLVFPKRGAAIYQNKIRILAQDSYMDTNLMTLTVDSKIDYEYLFYYLNKRGLSHIADVTSVPQINNKHIIPFRIIYPKSKSEQTAIATVLSDTDALIEHLGKLIAKKKAIKQGTMQQLLSGKKRLPGFSGEWEVKKLGEIAEFYKGKGLPKSEITTNGKHKCIHYGELFTIYHEEIKKIFSYTNKKDNFFLSRTNDVLMPTSDVTPNGLATASCVKENEVILGGDVLVIRSFEGVLDGVFLSYGIRKNRKQIMQLVSGSTVYHLYGSDMKKYKFSIPPTIEEQIAIATILSDMDLEIEKLEQKRNKTIMLKQGTMQQLLTGRIRIYDNN